MSKLTDSEGEYQPADVEDLVPMKNRQVGKLESRVDKLQAFFNELDNSCDGSFNLSDEEN